MAPRYALESDHWKARDGPVGEAAGRDRAILEASAVSLTYTIFEAEYSVEDLEPPYDLEAVKQALQDALGFTGLVILEVILADGATDA